MELKEYLQIIKKYKNLFTAIIVGVMAVALVYFYFRPISYATSLTLNITRSGVQDSQDYKYDDFYRLQADEKFAETIVEWLKSPRVEEDILKKSGVDTKNYNLKKLTKSIKAEKRSSQIVAVSFSSVDQKTSQNIAEAISIVIFENTANLNKNQKENTWFEIIAKDPVIKINKTSPLVFLIALIVGIFLGFWAVMIKHYFE